MPTGRIYYSNPFKLIPWLFLELGFGYHGRILLMGKKRLSGEEDNNLRRKK